MRSSLFVVFVFLLGPAFQADAQVVQWANALDFEYNAFGPDNWSGKQVLGEPDAKPYGSPSERAFRLKEESGFGTVVVEFAQPMEVSFVVIVESHLPGRVADVSLIDDRGHQIPHLHQRALSQFRTFSCFTHRHFAHLVSGEGRRGQFEYY
ncbi:MAG: hypothetical protein HC842_01995 [Cytophagales bacterium]|nr:hypothetical protein [Cytophagales bacterium]